MTFADYYPLVTIAIPTYNRAGSYLKQSLESALSQTYANIEIIVSDNCSTDNTETFVKEYPDARVRYFRQKENIGVVKNTAFCLDQAKGDYFLLLQDDDLVDADFIETCIKNVCNNQSVGIIRTGVRLINDEGDLIYETPNMVGGLSTVEFIRAWFNSKPKASMHLCSTLFNTQRLKETGGFKSKHFLFDDVMTEFELAAKFGRIDIPDIKASNRRHMNEMTYTVNVREWCEDSLMLLDLMCNLVPDESRTLIKNEGMRFFSKLNYFRAWSVKSRIKRFIAYLTVFNKFGYRYFPPKNYLPPSIKTLLYESPIYLGIRFIKRKAQQLLQYNS
jgi:glycosyltransferase involved in cell wall biosynthesis